MAATLPPLSKLKPGVAKVWLYFAAGLLWFGVGILLDDFAARWLGSVDRPHMLLLILAGLALAAIYFLCFSKLARMNILRIRLLPGKKVCLFAFQARTSYPLIALMMALGIYLRRYSAFPKPLLAIVYLGIGSALSAASLHYFAHLAHALRAQPARVQDRS